MVTKLPVEKLRNTCDANLMQCESAKDLTPLPEIIGQGRAVRALKFGLFIKKRDNNNQIEPMKRRHQLFGG